MSTPRPACRAHGPGLAPSALVGRRVVAVAAAWHEHEGRQDPIPVDVWLLDERGGAVRLGAGTDWCLEVEAEPPYEGYDMGDWGRIAVGPADDRTPFAPHLGHPVLAARPEHHPLTGRTALELDFPHGTVRCESTGGELLLHAVPVTGAP
ncbi:hypothetical protein [Streptomyces rubellomurinus]|uniref:Uncharacterized protein n=1 Tax=Streptomyces rubellomurinus (strain ATCC 31215) TaxID=359131 RepID=A0A0F2T651_STRR3|nr:hypothetical protein [Streptomyces rubellomurinus]KJS58694.1 hypothetical protein VM95_31665 [Streptomyces rubellomurinus]